MDMMEFYYWEKKKESQDKVQIQESCTSHITKPCKPKFKEQCHGMVQATTSYLKAMWWYLSSWHASSHELKPCSSRVQSAFHKELRTLAFFQGLYKKNNISRVERQSRKEEKKEAEDRNRGLKRQRSYRGLEIDSIIFSVNLFCFCFLLLFMDFVLANSG